MRGMNQNNVVKVIAVLGLLLMGLFILTFWVTQDSRADSFPEVKVFQATQEEKDRLPEQLGLQDTIDPVTTRLLGERLVGGEVKHRYWAGQALDMPGRVCVITLFEFPQDDNFMAGSGCNDFFQQHGASVTLEAGQHFSLVAFIPDGYAENARRLLPEATVMDNLIIFDSEEAKELAISRHGDGIVSIPPDEAPTRLDQPLLYLHFDLR